MKRLLLASALPALLATDARADGSVLERVLGTLGSSGPMTQLNGVFANIAETRAGGTASAPVTLWMKDNQIVPDSVLANYQSLIQSSLNSLYDGRVSRVGDHWHYSDTNADYPTEAAARAAVQAWYLQSIANQIRRPVSSLADVATAYMELDYGANRVIVPGTGFVPGTIDGSISNVLTGMAATSNAVSGSVQAVRQVTVGIGDLSTTVLGAVNTGDVTLGANQRVNEVIRRRSSALSNSIHVIGGLALNVAANDSDVLGQVSNSVSGLDGAVGDVATTVLGAVNTGTISSGLSVTTLGIHSRIIGR